MISKVDEFFTSEERRRSAVKVRDIEILRMSAQLDGDDFVLSANIARDIILKWANAPTRSGGDLPREAFEHRDFELLRGGRSYKAIRLRTELADLWAYRAEVPDSSVPGRVWTSEFFVGGTLGDRPHFGARLLASTDESSLSIEHHVPGPVLQIAQEPGLIRGARRLRREPYELSTANDVHDLCDFLQDPERGLPIIVSATSHQGASPLIDDVMLARALTGLARLYRIPAQLTWIMTHRLGKQRSVFDDAVRIYMPGFSIADDPYLHRLFLGVRLQTDESRRLVEANLRQLVANHGVASTRLGKDVLEFSAVQAAAAQLRGENLAERNAPEAEQLSSALEHIAVLKHQLEKKADEVDALWDEAQSADERARTAEQEKRSLLARVRLLTRGRVDVDTPISEEDLPSSWLEFADWVDKNYPDKVVFTPAARRMMRSPAFEDVACVARSIRWLATDHYRLRLQGGASTRDMTIEPGIRNAYCGGDRYETLWEGRRYTVDQHIKNGGNSHDPKRCLRIYYFWEEDTQLTVVDHLPAHRTTSAT